MNKIKTSGLSFAIPGGMFILVFFVYPILGILWKSIEGNPVSFASYKRLIEDPVYFQILFNTFEIAFGVTIICLLLGYPVAYLFCNIPKRYVKYMMIFIVIPYFTSSLIRTYAWMILLGREGIINKILLLLGLAHTPVQFMYSRFAVLIGVSYILLPYMILSLYSVLSNIDFGLLKAAQSLGANARRCFFKILLPLSMPGIASGSLLVFILTLGYFITPALMGGDKEAMIAVVIDNQVEVALDWGFGSALSVLLLTVTIVGFFLYDKMMGIEKLFEGNQTK